MNITIIALVRSFHIIVTSQPIYCQLLDVGLCILGLRFYGQREEISIRMIYHAEMEFTCVIRVNSPGADSVFSVE